jgi:hypothetical protein
MRGIQNGQRKNVKKVTRPHFQDNTNGERVV